MDAIFLIAFITPALFHLGARAKLTQPIHSRYPAWLTDLANCAACAGAWYALATAAVLLAVDWPVLGLTTWWALPLAWLFGSVWTPIAANWHESALMSLALPTDPGWTPVDALPTGLKHEAPAPMAVDLSALRVQVQGIALEAQTVGRHTSDVIAANAFKRIADQAEHLAASL